MTNLLRFNVISGLLLEKSFNKRELAPGGVLWGQKSNPKKFPVILTNLIKSWDQTLNAKNPCWIHLGHLMEYFITGVGNM